MGKILTVRVVPDLFLSSPKSRPKADNGRARARADDERPPSYRQSQRDVRLKPSPSPERGVPKRKLFEIKSSESKKEAKFSPKRQKSHAKQLRIQAAEAQRNWGKAKVLKSCPSFEFLPVSLPGTPPPEYLGARSRAPSILPHASSPADVSDAAQAGAQAVQASAAVAVAPRAPQAPTHFPHHAWTPASVTMILLWAVMFGVTASPAYEAIKAMFIFGVVVGTCVRHMYLETHHVEGQPYPWF